VARCGAALEVDGVCTDEAAVAAVARSCRTATPRVDDAGGVADAASVDRTASARFAAVVDGSAADRVGCNDRRGAFDGRASDGGVAFDGVASLGAGVCVESCSLLLEDGVGFVVVAVGGAHGG